jgi:hypothetical protein
MLTTEIPTRVFELEKYGLAIKIVQKTDARGAIYNFWNVTFGGRTVKTGLIEREHCLPTILKRIADDTTLRTDGGDMLLRSLTWAALVGCIHVPASELRIGDRMVISGTTAHTVESVTAERAGTLLVNFEGRMPPRRFPENRLCNLLARGPQT